MSRGAVENRPARFRVEDGVFAVMAAADDELRRAGVKAYTWLSGGTPFVVLLFDLERAAVAAVIEADKLGQLRRRERRGGEVPGEVERDALGVIGCGWQAESQVACIREACPTIERVVASAAPRTGWGRSAQGRRGSGRDRDPAEQDVSSPVHFEGSRPSRRVATTGRARVRCRRKRSQGASWTTPCSSARPSSAARLPRAVEARIGRPDRARPQGVLDWLEVHELHEVVAGELPGRQSDDDIVLFKSNGIAAWDVAIAEAARRPRP